jgi:hypothetical protein
MTTEEGLPMALQYVVTQTEFDALFQRLELAKLQADRGLRTDIGKAPTLDDMHRIFHYEVARWAQETGYRVR